MLSYIACLAEGGAWDKGGLEQQLEINDGFEFLVFIPYFRNDEPILTTVY